MSSNPVVNAEVARARALLGSAITEKEFQSNVVELASRLRWRSYHTLDSTGSAAGFPDVVLVRGTRLVMAELKRDNGRISSAQQAWLDDLERVRSVGAYLWRPKDWDELEAVLR